MLVGQWFGREPGFQETSKWPEQRVMLLYPAVAVLMTGLDGIFSTTVEARARKGGGKSPVLALFSICFFLPTFLRPTLGFF